MNNFLNVFEYFYQSAYWTVKMEVDVEKKMICSDVGVQRSFMVEVVKRKMSATQTPVFMDSVGITKIATVVAVHQGTME